MNLAKLTCCAIAPSIGLAGISAAQDQSAEGASLVTDLHTAFGKHEARAVHAKGVILTGTFKPSAEAPLISRAGLFRAPASVTLRFSNFTGFPDIRDNDPNANPRGMAIKFGTTKDPILDVITHSFNGFPTRTAAEFGMLLRAIGTSGPGVSSPTPLETFLLSHPIAKTFLTTQKPPPVSYATAAYYGVNAVTFTDRSGQELHVRYRFIPVGGEHYFDPTSAASLGKDYLRQEIALRVGGRPFSFDWYAQIAEDGDAIDDPSIAWPESRRLVKLGTITITKMGDNSVAGDRALWFQPDRMPDGIAIADPMLAIRAAAYPLSVKERQ